MHEPRARPAVRADDRQYRSVRGHPTTLPQVSQHRSVGSRQTDLVLTAFGVTAVTFMMVMYAFERRHSRFILAFAAGCLLSSAYGFLAGTWPFGVVEVIWAAVALERYHRQHRE